MARPTTGLKLTGRSMRLDDEVWATLQTLATDHGSINEGLRVRLLSVQPASVETTARTRKASKKQAEIEALKASDPLAKDRDDIDYSSDAIPMQHVTQAMVSRPLATATVTAAEAMAAFRAQRAAAGPLTKGVR